MALVTNLLNATELAVGRNIEWTWIDTPGEMLYPPGVNTDNPNPGISVVDAVSAYVLLSPKARANARSAFFTIDRTEFLSGTTYTIEVDAGTYTTTGEATAMDAVADLVNDINTAAIANTTAVAVARTSDGILDTVHVYELDTGSGGTVTAANPVFDMYDDSGGSTASEGYADPASFKARIWLKPSTPTGIAQSLDLPWVLALNGDYEDVPDQGIAARINVAGFERLYVEVYEVTDSSGDFSTGGEARPTVFVGKAIAEDE